MLIARSGLAECLEVHEVLGRTIISHAVFHIFAQRQVCSLRVKLVHQDNPKCRGRFVARGEHTQPFDDLVPVDLGFLRREIRETVEDLAVGQQSLPAVAETHRQIVGFCIRPWISHELQIVIILFGASTQKLRCGWFKIF